MKMEYNKILKQIPREQRSTIAATMWVGDLKHPENSPKYIYENTNKKLKDVLTKLKNKSCKIEEIKNLTYLLQKNFYNKRNAKKYNSETEYEIILNKLTSLNENILNKSFVKEDVVFVKSLIDDIKLAEEKQFKKLLKQFGLDSL